MPFKNPHPLYNVWRSMRYRCMNPNFKQWDDYGGRGIRICPEWDEFHQFVADMGPRPDGYSLDRIDNDGDYEPGNCRWASRRTQQRNQRRALYVTIEGKKYRAIELAEKAGVKTDTIVERAAAGVPLSDITKKRLKMGPKPRTHCSRGHLLDETNTYVNKHGWRLCRACHNAKMRRYNAAKKPLTS